MSNDVKSFHQELFYLPDEVTSNGEGNDGTDANIDALRATEYEQLARLCLEEKQ